MTCPSASATSGLLLSFVPFAALLLAPAAAAQNPISLASVDSVGAQGNSDSGSLSRPSVSDDGRFVAFESTASDLVAGDTNGKADIFVHDRVTGATARVSVSSAGVEAGNYSSSPALSSDGRFVAFESLAKNLVANDFNGSFDVFVHDRDPDVNGVYDEGNGVTTRVSTGFMGLQGNADSFTPSISDDGSQVAFASAATNLVFGDKNGVTDVFVHDRNTATTIRVSSPSGLDGNAPSSSPSISGDGSMVAYSSYASNLIGSDTNGYSDVYVTDVATGTITRMSVDSAGVEGNDDSSRPAFSADGTVVAFTSSSSNLVAGDANFVSDVFVHELATGLTARVSVESSGTEGNGPSASAALSTDGQIVVFESSADNFVANDGNFSNDVFLHDRVSGLTECLTVNAVGGIADGFGSNGAALSSDGMIAAFASSASNLVTGDVNGVLDVFARDRNVVPPLASWANYGVGLPGSLSTPTLTASANPVFGTTFSLDAGNSLGAATPGFLFLGLNSAFLPTNLGSAILVDFLVILPVTVPANGLSLSGSIPPDMLFFGLHIYGQILELDSGAPRGVSFSQGIDLALGL